MNGQADCNCSLLKQNNSETISLNTLLQSKDPICKAIGLAKKAQDYLQLKKLTEAEQVLLESKTILLNKPCAKDLLLDTYKMLDNIYVIKADFEKALSIDLAILAILETKKDTAGIARTNLNISNVFFRIKQFEKGIEYNRKAISVINTLSPSNEKASLLTKAAQRYYTYYESNKIGFYLDTMGMITNEAKKLIGKVPLNKKTILLIYTRLVTIAIAQKQFKKALEYIDFNIKQCDTKTDIPELAVNYSDKAEIMFQLKRYSEALQWADSSMVYTKMIGSPPHLANLYKLIAEIAEKSGNTTKALSAFKAEKKITDSLNNAAKVSAIEELEYKYQQSKNEQKIKELDQQKKILVLISLTILLGLTIVVFAFRQKVLRNKQKVLFTEQRLNRARINPHFFFNALAALQNTALNNNTNNNIANQLAKFSFIMRETLESSYKEWNSIESEITFLSTYLNLQKNRFPEKFQYHFEIDNDIEQDEVVIPSMIIQPFIENSIEHGFNEINYTGELKILFSIKEKELFIQIIDNGKGFTDIKNDKHKHNSRATQIINDRLYLLNSQYKCKANYSLEKNENNPGVTVKILLPLFYKSTLNYKNENIDN
jgi:tetratricopeptide (TPR) repeat protein